MLFRTVVVLLVACLWFTASLNAQPKPSSNKQTYSISVTGCDAGKIAGAELRVLAYHPEVKGLRQLSKVRPKLDRQGRCEVELAPGRYVFEVLHQPDADTLVAVRSRPTGMNEAGAIEIPAGPATRLDTRAGGAAVALEVVTIRSAALEGALVGRTDTSAPTVILSPDKRYMVGVLGRHGACRYAFWLRVKAEDLSPLKLPVEKALRATVRWREGSPLRDVARPARLVLSYPDAKWYFEFDTEVELLTNRRYVELAYDYPTTSGGGMHFHQRGYVLGRQTQLEVGGPLSDHAYAGVHRRRNDDGYEHRLSGVFWLSDPGGHQFNPEASKVKITKSLVLLNGEAPPRPPFADGVLDSLRPLSKNLRVQVSYELDGLRELTLVPVEAVQMRSKHFVLRAVPGWEFRSQMYLLRAERSFEMLGPISAYPASSWVNIGWLTNTSRARGGWNGKRKGAKRGFINMPFKGYQDSFGLFTHTRFLTHEVAHTYGYSHGDTMKTVQREAERRYREFRWFVVDHPQYVPESSW